MNLKSIIESILFSVGEPVSIEKLSKTLKKENQVVLNALNELKSDYQNNERGLAIISKNNKVQLVTAPENSKYIEKLVKSDLQQELTPASLETLAIVAYKAPITRAEIEEVRGVNSSFILRNLLIRGLIERKGNPEDSRSYVYDISFNFLQKLGLKSKQELPEYNNLIEEFKK